ncbi:uncharacterized protein L201_001738 [Kwoniella dendrophila CBS 6074]|uniref:t-SNARE coiled-coil homology domain-containing protein n=1 Tax=Kwoniella dendrophila CBS 6074 TaxID=1295534 RepID=A0AAX4JQ49_9TREE
MYGNSSKSSPSAIPIIPQLWEVREKLQNDQKAMIETGFLKLPLTESELQKWCRICQDAEIKYGLPYGGHNKEQGREAIKNFRDKLLESVYPPRTNDPIENGMEARITAQITSHLENRFTQINQKFVEVDNKVTQLTAKIDKSNNVNQANQEDTNKNVNNTQYLPTQKRIDNLSDQFHTTRILVERLDAKVDRLDAKIDRDDGKISRIELQTEQQAKQLTGTQADIKKIFVKIEGMDLAENNAENEAQDVEHRIGVKEENDVQEV